MMVPTEGLYVVKIVECLYWGVRDEGPVGEAGAILLYIVPLVYSFSEALGGLFVENFPVPQELSPCAATNETIDCGSCMTSVFIGEKARVFDTIVEP